MNGRILVVDDDATMCDLLEAGLGARGFPAVRATGADAALAALETRDFDAVVTDLNMGGMNGLDLCARIVTNRPDVPVIVITAFGSMETAIGAIRVGAYDFITKPLEIDALALALGRAVQHRVLREEVKRLRKVVEEARTFEGIIGESAAMRRVFDLLDRVVDSDATVLVTGESGTGKEIVARALHARGRRREHPFVAVNCAAVPETLLESELFGHARGAFTDARVTRRGLFAQADGGTLFLDEIGALPLSLQPKLLRALQERRVRPVGSDEESTFDVRLIAATNRDLEVAVEEGNFREDLYFRLNVIPIELPPLRARGNDVLLLAQHFIDRGAAAAGRRVTGLSSEAAERLLAYRWPGNVRELQNCIERGIALTRYDRLTVEDLPEKLRTYRAPTMMPFTDDPTELVPLDEIERRYVLRVMDAVGGNKTLASEVLGVDRKTLYRKLGRYAKRE
jgi:two-component system response regulator HydG